MYAKSRLVVVVARIHNLHLKPAMVGIEVCHAWHPGGILDDQRPGIPNSRPTDEPFLGRGSLGENEMSMRKFVEDYKREHPDAKDPTIAAAYNAQQQDTKLHVNHGRIRRLRSELGLTNS